MAQVSTSVVTSSPPSFPRLAWFHEGMIILCHPIRCLLPLKRMLNRRLLHLDIKVGVNPDLLSQMERMIPLGRVGTPEEAAGAVYLFCSPESNFISGQYVICGGGFTI